MTQVAYSYDNAYEAGYNQAVINIMEQNRITRLIREEKEAAIREEKKESAVYFLKQKLAGAALLALSVGGIIITHGEFGAAFVTIPLSVLVMFTKCRIFR